MSSNCLCSNIEHVSVLHVKKVCIISIHSYITWYCQYLLKIVRFSRKIIVIIIELLFNFISWKIALKNLQNTWKYLDCFSYWSDSLIFNSCGICVYCLCIQIQSRIVLLLKMNIWVNYRFIVAWQYFVTKQTPLWLNLDMIFTGYWIFFYCLGFPLDS